MNVLQSRKPVEDRLEFLAKSLLRILDLSGVETYLAKEGFFYQQPFLTGVYATITGANRNHHTSNTANFEPRSNLGRKLSLSATQDNVQEFLARRHRSDLIER